MSIFIAMSGRLNAKARWFILFLAIAFVMPIAVSEPVYAENFFQRLFKGFKKKKKVEKPRVKRKKKKVARKKKVVPIVKKAENAIRILVVGDFFASALSKSLKAKFAKNPNVLIQSKIKNASGFVRDDHYNWPVELPAIVEKQKPDLLVIMMGINDRQQMRFNDEKIALRSPEWDVAYQKKVVAFNEVIRDTNLPYIWMGLPPIKSTKASADMIFFNETFRSTVNFNAVDSGSSPYVDIWDGFADELGNFVRSGPDVNGKLVRLRLNDGINFSRGGRAKLAFYAEKAIRKFFPAGFDLTDDAKKEKIAIKKILIDPRTTGRTEIISLNELNLTTDQLIGSKEDFAAIEAAALKAKKNDKKIIQPNVLRMSNVGLHKLESSKDALKSAPLVTPKGLYKAEESALKRADYFTAR
jgi:hypothetical protein